MGLTSALVSFALVAALVTITPGLDTTLVLRTAARRGRRAAFATAFGINTGVLVWAVAAAVGLSALLTASQAAYTLVRYAGAAYLIWLGARMLRSAFSGNVGNDNASSGNGAADRGDDNSGVGSGTVGGDHAGQGGAVRTAGRGGWACYRQGLLANLLNPKVGVFYVALLPQFVPPGYSPALVGILLGSIHNLEGLVWFSLIIVAVDRMRAALRRPRVQRWIDGVAGTAVVAFGLTLIDAR